ncbi:MAG: phosphatase PAP2 family protein [Pseudomonadota bacterium]
MRVLDSIQSVDRRLLLKMSDSQHPAARFSRLVSRTADGHLYLALPLLLYQFVPDGERLLISCAAAFSIERCIYWCLKKSFKRRRPEQAIPWFRGHIVAADEFSLPSGHTSAAFLFVTILVLNLGPSCVPLYAWSYAVAMSRVFLGVHFPSDTVVGACIGSSIAYLTYLVVV